MSYLRLCCETETPCVFMYRHMHEYILHVQTKRLAKIWFVEEVFSLLKIISL